MPTASLLADEIGKLFTGVAKDILGKFKKEDKDALAQYAQRVAALALQLQAETDPARKKVIEDNLETYKNAATLMAAKYELMAASSLEKAGIDALKLALEAVVKILVAAV